VKVLISKIFLIVQSWDKTNCTIACDGWTNTTNRPLLNILAILPNARMFKKTTYNGGKEKISKFTTMHIFY
jgi:hypothetical protein